MRNKGFIIAIDGYSSCGKSTFAQAIAAKLGYIFIDTGAMYRAITYAIIKGGLLQASDEEIKEFIGSQKLEFIFSKKHGKNAIHLNGECVEDIARSEEVTKNVSQVAAIAPVRERLVAMQQEIGKDGGVVMDGRDIGTVVFANAEIKIFMTASTEIRGERRYAENMAKGLECNLEEITKQIAKRDYDDENREISPLRKADDAIVLDNSTMSVEDQMLWFEQLYSSKI